VLKNILHVPNATKNMLSIHQFTTDNRASLEYFPIFFLVKDLDTRRTLPRGWCRHGLYPLPAKLVRKHAFRVIKSSLARWHHRLGHHSSTIVKKVISGNNLPCLSESNKETICDASQKAKSHQLPYTSSSHVSTSPLELVFSGVWGLAPHSL
jgi:hypothetical protein